MPYTLVVIDMQDYFTGSKTAKVRKGCARAIRQAMNDKAAILYVEYQGYGSTISMLTNLSKNYKRVSTVKKASNGGEQEVRRLLLRKKFPKTHLKICGVNTDYCVLETVQGITGVLPKTKLHVIESACNSNGNHKDGIRRLKAIEQVRVTKHLR